MWSVILMLKARLKVFYFHIFDLNSGALHRCHDDLSAQQSTDDKKSRYADLEIFKELIQ